MSALVKVEPAGPTAIALANLARHAHHARGAYAANTERALKADIAIFTRWCADAGRDYLPADPGTMAGFVDAMAEQKAPATVRRYVSSIATFHRAAEMVSPAGAMEVRNALKRMHRTQGRAQAQAAPLTRPVVERLLSAAGVSVRSQRNRALLAVAYDTLCRRSELAGLDLADLEVGATGDGTVTVRRSKTDQEGAGMVRYLAADTVREVMAWTAAAKLEDGRLFRSVSRAGAVGGPIDTGDVARIFKAMALAANLPPETVARISGHSSRVGAAQDMVQHGVELPAVMQAGGWRTAEMVGRYTRRLDARRSGAAKLAVLQNRG